MSVRTGSRVIPTFATIALSAVLALSAVFAYGQVGSVVSGKRLAKRDGRVISVTRERDRPRDRKQNEVNGEVVVSIPGEAAPTATTTPAPAATGACSGTKVPAGASIQAAINGSPEGATLCLSAGTYDTSSTIKLKSGIKLIGAGRTATFIKTTSAETVLEGRNTSNVLLQGFDVSGGVERGIRSGLNTVVNEVRAHHNGVTGIGGTDGNLVITNSELSYNGRDSDLGIGASGIKTGKAFTIKNSYVHDNTGVGIWCDVGCDGGTFTVQNNTVTNNVRGGIRYEISASAALISGNVVKNNNLENKGGHGGIEINSSRNAVVENNVLGGNKGAGIIVNGGRSPGTANITIRNNTLNGDRVSGCGASVSCATNE
ncbi:MAG: right-handed parallel beta-helix repeat-containing protein [Actinomycetota bacterium]